ncbi:MAG: hypothetical protein WD768_01425 [Phycisphaeraceae bacterium]
MLFSFTLRLIVILAACLCVCPSSVLAQNLQASPAAYFAIQVIDEDTGRGVPLVELRTVNDILFVTDSQGMIAFHEPGLMDREVFFSVFSHGYTTPKDGFGIRGVRLTPKVGGSATVKIKRTNIAQRLYRVTGQGIYRDSVLLGKPVPLKEPVINGGVLGQDSIFTVKYAGKLYWFWGDTNRASYPLGNFSMSGATSELPGKGPGGGLDPDKGVDLKYFVDDKGFSRGMAPLPRPGPVWLDAFMVLPDTAGREGMLAHYSRMESLEKRVEHGLMLFNDKTQTFEHVATYGPDVTLHPHGAATPVEVEGVKYFYFAYPYPLIRVKAEWGAIHDLKQYEAFTCLPAEAIYAPYRPQVERDGEGKVVWAWKKNTDYMDEARQRKLIAAGVLKEEEAWINLRDADSKKPVTAHASSLAWNAYRKKYIMIFSQINGTSFLGETWYSEADGAHGPWRWAKKIVSHEKYTFYNPRHHAFFDADGGRTIYFEATYTDQFSGASAKTPRYDYNQIMYKLDLGDERMKLAE